MTEAKRARPARREDWNEDEMCHWLRLVDLAETAEMIEGLAQGQQEARCVARFYCRLANTGRASLVLPGRSGPPEWLEETP